MTTADDSDPRPPLNRDSSYWGMTTTQFFGAFNDNLFKQLVLLVCVDVAKLEGKEDFYQGLAGLLFSLPFILFSGFAGFLADRFAKRPIVILCKFAEIGITLLAMTAFLLSARAGGGIPNLSFLLGTLFLMGTHSAFFGPPKYGILPEMVRKGDLPRANGVFLMTTFLAIIFGQALAGSLKESLAADQLWMVSGCCAFVAILGTATSFLVRHTPPAQPDLKFEVASLAIPSDLWATLKRDRPLLTVLVVSSVFWFLGGIVQPAVNNLGKNQLELADRATSLMLVCVALGIAVGCAAAGRLCGKEANFTLVKLAAWGMFGCFVLLSIPGKDEHSTLLGRWGGSGVLALLGVFAGMFSVPLQVFLQARAPDEQKGRIIAAMNLMNWIAIFLSQGVYTLLVLALGAMKYAPCGLFAATAVFLLPVAVLFRPGDAYRTNNQTAGAAASPD